MPWPHRDSPFQMTADFAPDPPEPLPIAGAEDGLGDQGMRIVDRIVSEDLGWVFRDQTRKGLRDRCADRVDA